MNDSTKELRRERLSEINAVPGSRQALEAQYGQVWDTQQLAEDFEVLGSWLRSLSFAAKATG